MRSVVVVVGVAMAFVVSASPLPEIFHNHIALYGNSLQCQTQSKKKQTPHPPLSDCVSCFARGPVI